LVEGKDWSKLPNSRWAFLMKWENEEYTKTVELLLDMMEPSMKVLTGDSGFCVAVGVTALHKKEVGYT
jgi:hypothetical protein